VHNKQTAKEKIMVRRRTALQSFRRTALMGLVAGAFVSACAPGLSPEQVQSLVGTGVAQTVEAQNNMGTAVAQTVEAMAPASTATSSPTLPSLTLPTLTPIIPTVTPFVISGGGGGGGGGGKAKYACEAWTVKPDDYEAFKPGDPFDIKWIITNTGSEDIWAGTDLGYYSGPRMTNHADIELPLLEPGDTYTLSADANAPLEKGTHVMTWRVQGGLCWPYVAIISGRPGDP
jgi:hypothetical protein